SEVEGQRLPVEGTERGVAVLGSGGMLEAIESALVGMAAGEEKAIEVNFPEGWRVPQLAGRTAKVHLRAERVSEPVLPEVDAAFIRSFGRRSGEIGQLRADTQSEA